MRPQAAFLESEVYHARAETAANAFKYPVLNVFFRVEESARLDQTLRKKFLSLVSLSSQDYLSKKSEYSLEQQIRDFVQTRFQYRATDVYLQTIPKMAGYVFNPVSFWYFFKSEVLEAVLCEVNNTFGEKHYYWLYQDGQDINGQWLECKKEFHVSPFFAVDGKYKFHFLFSDTGVKAQIRLLTDEGRLKLNTWIRGDFISIESLSPMRLLWRYGWMTPLVVLRIHYQALILFFKKVRFYRKPDLPSSEVTSKANGT